MRDTMRESHNPSCFPSRDNSALSSLSCSMLTHIILSCLPHECVHGFICGNRSISSGKQMVSGKQGKKTHSGVVREINEKYIK